MRRQQTFEGTASQLTMSKLSCKRLNGGYYTASAPGTSNHRVRPEHSILSTDYRISAATERRPGVTSSAGCTAEGRPQKGQGVVPHHIPYASMRTTVLLDGGNIRKKSSHSGTTHGELRNARPIAHDPVHAGAIRTWTTFDWDATGAGRFEIFAGDSGHQPHLLEQPGFHVLSYDRSLLLITRPIIDLAAGSRRTGKKNIDFRAYGLFP